MESFSQGEGLLGAVKALAFRDGTNGQYRLEPLLGIRVISTLIQAECRAYTVRKSALTGTGTLRPLVMNRL